MNKLKSNISKISAAAILGTFGLVAAQQADSTPQTVEAATSVVTINYVPGYSIKVRSNPNDLTSWTGQYLKHGTAWKVIGTKIDGRGQKWFDLGNNQWIEAKYTVAGLPKVSQSSTANTKIQAVINLAKKQLGKPYVWGGKGANAFDCSGLMYYVFNNAAGKNIGGWTVPQESAGRQVSISQLQAGDLVFWGSRGNTYHVALYLGNNQYIHAPQPGQGVSIASISSYYMPSFGVRVF